jgi:hypothetical protein
MDRQVIIGDIVHYSFGVRVGPGPFDVIGLHRVVRETRPFRPIRTAQCVFFDHGDFTSFVSGFLTATLSPEIPDDYCLPVYLAENDIDIWESTTAGLVPPKRPTSQRTAGNHEGYCPPENGLAYAAWSAWCRSGGTRLSFSWSTGSVGRSRTQEESQLPLPLRHVRDHPGRPVPED